MVDLNWFITKHNLVLIAFSFNFRDHFFETKERRRTKGQRKVGTLSDFGAPPRRAQPVRSYHRCDESKIVPEKLFGNGMVDEDGQ